MVGLYFNHINVAESSARNSGVQFDSALSFEAHIKKFSSLASATPSSLALMKGHSLASTWFRMQQLKFLWRKLVLHWSYRHILREALQTILYMFHCGCLSTPGESVTHNSSVGSFCSRCCWSLPAKEKSKVITHQRAEGRKSVKNRRLWMLSAENPSPNHHELHITGSSRQHYPSGSLYISRLFKLLLTTLKIVWFWHQTTQQKWWPLWASLPS